MPGLASRLRAGEQRRLALIAAAVLVIAVAILAVADGLLLSQNRQLRAALDSARISLLPQAGKQVPALRGMTVAGLPVTVGYGAGQKPALIFVFSSRCPFCSATWPEWHAIVERADPRRVRLVFLNIAAPLKPDFVLTHHLAHATVLDSISPKDAVAYNLLLAPELIEVSGSGAVRHTWAGKPDSAAMEQLFAIAGGQTPPGALRRVNHRNQEDPK